MTHNPNVYGYVNGKPVFSRDEFIFEHRKRGPIEDDAELIALSLIHISACISPLQCASGMCCTARAVASPRAMAADVP